MENPRASQVVIQCDTRCSITSTRLLIVRNVQHWEAASGTAFVNVTPRRISALWFRTDYAASNWFVNCLTPTLRVSKVVSRDAGHTTPRLVIVIVPVVWAPPARPTIAMTRSLVTIIVTVVS